MDHKAVLHALEQNAGMQAIQQTALLQTLITEIQSLKETIEQRKPSERRLYSMKEVCHQTGLSVMTIRQGMNAGRYIPYRHGTVLRFDLDQIIEAMRQEGGAHV